MQKDFNEWNEVKKKLALASGRKYFKVREVWWCHLGVNLGDEEDGKGPHFFRPVLIIKKFNYNLFVAIPLSTSLKDKTYYHCFEFKNKRQSAILSQIRLLDTKRLAERMGSITDPEFDTIKKKIKELIF